jgi:hypothetical protein
VESRESGKLPLKFVGFAKFSRPPSELNSTANSENLPLRRSSKITLGNPLPTQRRKSWCRTSQQLKFSQHQKFHKPPKDPSPADFQHPQEPLHQKIHPHKPPNLDCKIFWEQNFASFLERNFGLEFAGSGGIWRIRQIIAEICRICRICPATR